jgi:hypothetical protein
MILLCPLSDKATPPTGYHRLPTREGLADRIFLRALDDPE